MFCYIVIHRDHVLKLIYYSTEELYGNIVQLVWFRPDLVLPVRSLPDLASQTFAPYVTICFVTWA